MTDARNVLGEPLVECCTKPMTGFYRDGSCNTGPEDFGMHTVCTQVDAAFLAFSQAIHPGARIRVPRVEAGRLLVPLCRTLEGGVRGRQSAKDQTDGHARSDARRGVAGDPQALRHRSELSGASNGGLDRDLPERRISVGVRHYRTLYDRLLFRSARG